MKDEEMAEEYICNGKCQDDITRNYVHCKTCTRIKDFLAGLKAGSPQWHYPSKGELPRKSDSILCELMPLFVAVKVGYRVSTYGTYWNLKLGKFECLDEVYAWCYTPEPPELPKESK